MNDQDKCLIWGLVIGALLTAGVIFGLQRENRVVERRQTTETRVEALEEAMADQGKALGMIIRHLETGQGGL